MRIPPEFRPGLAVQWYGRGENALAKRRAELRAVAKTRIDAAGKRAKSFIEARTTDVLTELVSRTLQSDEARGFLKQIPTAAALMPPLVVAELEGGES